MALEVVLHQRAGCKKVEILLLADTGTTCAYLRCFQGFRVHSSSTDRNNLGQAWSGPQTGVQ